MPILFPSATAVATASAPVLRPRITSNRGIRWTGEKKCIPTTFCGRDASSAMSPMGIDEVFEAMMAFGASLPTSRTTACLMDRSSNTASMTTSALRMPL